MFKLYNQMFVYSYAHVYVYEHNSAKEYAV